MQLHSYAVSKVCSKVCNAESANLGLPVATTQLQFRNDTTVGDAENAGLEYAGPEYAAPNCRGGICRTGKYGTVRVSLGVYR